MARIGGRNTGIALVAGLLCVSVLAGLTYLAAPLGPATLEWVSVNLDRAIWRE